MSGNPDQKVAEVLSSLDLAGKHIVAAVSGGADSVFLLCVLHRLKNRFGYTLSAVTVNHLIRSEAESSGDAFYVEELCRTLDPPVICYRKDLEPGEVDRMAADRRRGTEDAARYLRYRYFTEVAASTGASWIMTGHNRNDRLETVLMRFFQGACGASLSGIARRRGRYFRPLLDIRHEDMTVWLSERGILWREDATNSDDRYLRNRLRLHVIPLLESVWPGWDTGVIAASAKASLDEDLCRSLIAAEWKQSGKALECDAASFEGMHPAVRLRFLQDGLLLLGVGHRVPYGLLARIACGELPACGATAQPYRISGSGLDFVRSGDTIFWGPDIVQNSKTGYLVSICACGRYCLPFGTITVSGSGKSVYIDNCLGPFELPLTVRSRAGGDTVRTADGKQKILKKLMNEWSVREFDRNLLPVIEQDGLLRAVYGSPLGYPDWYVQI